MFKTYGFFGTLRLLISFLYTKLFFKNARLIRLPFDIRNRRHIDIGKEFTTGFGCRIESYSKKNTIKSIVIGDNVQINDYVHISAINSVHIADNVLIASKVYISDHNHGSYANKENSCPDVVPLKRKLYSDPVFIEENVWIGESVCVLPGVTIGKGSIVGALSLVNKNIPSYTIAVGNPARVIKKFNFDKKIWEKI